MAESVKKILYMFKLPYSTLLFTGIILLLMSLFKWKNTFDIHLHDTYYVIYLPTFYRFLAAVLIFYWLLYIWTRKLLYSKILTWVHVILTLLFGILLATSPFGLNAPEQLSSNDYIQITEQLNRNYRISLVFHVILILGQLTFAGNLIAGVIKKLLK